MAEDKGEEEDEKPRQEMMGLGVRDCKRNTYESDWGE